MTSAVIGFGCLIKMLKFKEIKSRRKDWLENVIHSFSKTRLQLIYQKKKRKKEIQSMAIVIASFTICYMCCAN